MESFKKIPDRMFFRIGDVSEIVGVKPYVLRFWESEFPMLSPEKSNAGQRIYRKVDVENLVLIKHLLYEERFSIEGARRKLRELKREGELKAAREAVPEISEASDASEPSPEKLVTLEGEVKLVEFDRTEALQASLREGLRQLRELSRVPSSEIFKFASR